MNHKIAPYCLIFLLLCGCASLSGTPGEPPPPGSPATQMGPEGLEAPSEELPPEDGSELEGLEEEPLVSEEMPEANPDEVLGSDTAEADRIKEQARALEEEIKEEVSFDIPIVLNERVAYFLEYFQHRVPEQFGTWLSRSTAYLPRMQEIFREQGLPEDLAYLALIESGFNPRAYSRSRAVGPWQFIRGTGRRYGLKQNWWVDERRDFEKSTYAAAAYLTDLYEEFGSWYLAAAAYNCGEGRIRRAIRRYQTDDYWEICDHRAVSRETRDYVPKMIAAILIAKEPAKYGFGDVCYQTPLEWDLVEIDRPTDLSLLAELCATDRQYFKDLNPELRRNWTPPVKGEPYRLRVPSGRGEQLLARLAERKDRAVNFVVHTVRPGDTLWEISRAHGCPLQVLIAANNIRSSRHLRLGQKLIIPVGMGERQAKAFARATRTAKSAPPKTCRVRRGDSLYRIARRYGISVARLRRLNPGVGDLLYPGQRLAITKAGRVVATRTPSGKRRVHTYRVKPGDTLWKIARRYNVGVNELRSWNGLHKGEHIYPGDRLKLTPGDRMGG